MMMNRHRKEAEQPFAFEDYFQFAVWFQQNARWEADEIWGFLDNVTKPSAMWYQFQQKGYMKGDCDDLAMLAGSVVHGLGHETYIAVLSPRLGFKKDGKKKSFGHVICAFQVNDIFKVFSNNRLLPTDFKTLRDALFNNGFYPPDEMESYDCRSFTNALEKIR